YITRPRGTGCYFFRPPLQLTTTVSGVDAMLEVVATTKRFPSAVTSYWNATWPEPSPIRVSNSGTGIPASIRDFGRGLLDGWAVCVAAAVRVPFWQQKKKPLPWRCQRGCSPHPFQIFIAPSPAGNRRTYASRRPDASDV